MKKSRKITILLILGILILSLYYSIHYINDDSVEATLIKSFNKSSAKVISSEIYFTGVVLGNKNDFNKQKLFIENLAKKIGVLKNEAYVYHQIDNDSIQKIEISGSTIENRAVDINLGLNDISEGEENTLTVDITQYETLEGLEEIEKEVSNILRSYKINPKVNSCITGSLSGKYENSQIDELCDEILKSAEAEKVYSTKDRNLMSVSAYSHILGSSLSISGKKMNLNLAVRYNSLENKTYIWLATPVITIEY